MILTLPARYADRCVQADEASDKALQQAILAFPQVVLILADKAGFTVDQKVRDCSAFDMEVAYR